MELNELVIIDAKSQLKRKDFGVDLLAPIDIFSLIGQIDNLTLIRYPFSDNISGICLKNESISLIAINSNMSYGRQRFSLSHELYHLFYDEHSCLNICSKNIDKRNINELKADMFASYLLMPPTALQAKLKNINDITLKDIINLEQYFQISHKAMLTRLIMAGYLKEDESKKFEKDIIKNTTKLGYDDSLYKPTLLSNGTYGYYIKQIEEISDKELMPLSKINEFLLDANREDMVPYNNFNHGGVIID